MYFIIGGGRQGGKGRYGNNSRTGVAVSAGNVGGGSQVRESMEREREEGKRGREMKER